MNNDEYHYPPSGSEPHNPHHSDNDRAAADIARAKLESVYNHTQPTHAPGSQITPDANPQPHTVPQNQNSYQGVAPQSQPADAQTFHLPGSQIQPEQPTTQEAPAPEPSTQQPQQPQPNSFDAFAAQRFNQTHSSQSQQPQSFGAHQNHEPAISQLYNQEQQQLNSMHPGSHYASPDHQLGPANNHYELQPAASGGIPSRFRPFLKTLVLALAIALFWNNQLILGKVQSYINPAQSVTSPVIVDPTATANISNEPRIIIPKINVDVPVVYDVTTYEESAIQEGLERGVVHYGQTAVPGENGNNVIVGHSSNSFWNDGDYKFAFVLLDRLNNGDTFELHYQGERYIYEVFKKEVVSPSDVSVAFAQYDQPVTTLITCTPPGTNWNRLVVVARQISPDPAEAKAADIPEPTPDGGTIPGEAPGVFDSLQSWF